MTLQVTTKSVDLLQHEVNILLGLSLVDIAVGDEDDEDGGNELFFRVLNWNGGYDENLIRDDDDDDDDDDDEDDDAHRRPD